MGKKRVIKKSGEQKEETPLAAKQATQKSSPKFLRGIVHIQATYNNTIITVTDAEGNTLAWSSAGSLGFTGAKKATPFAAARVAEVVVEKMQKSIPAEVVVRVCGVGSGRDSAVRALANHGLNLVAIEDITPLPHNGPRPKKVRRV